MDTSVDFETKETITFEEFRAWMNGLIQGKRGALPDLEDWKLIKQMMDRVIPEKEYISTPMEPFVPYSPPVVPSVPSYPDTPGTPWQPWNPWITCDGTNQISTDGITVTTSGGAPQVTSHTIQLDLDL